MIHVVLDLGSSVLYSVEQHHPRARKGRIEMYIHVLVALRRTMKSLPLTFGDSKSEGLWKTWTTYPLAIATAAQTTRIVQYPDACTARGV